MDNTQIIALVESQGPMNANDVSELSAMSLNACRDALEALAEGGELLRVNLPNGSYFYKPQ